MSHRESRNGRLVNVEAAEAYLRRGFMPVAVPPNRKGPVTRSWQTRVYTEDELTAHFNGTGNIGLLLGPLSRNLVDVDLDCPEALDLADEFLPDTPAETGRRSAPRSHRWYLAEGIETTQYRDPETKDMIVELRGAGAQTLVGPSVHPDSGERYDTLEGEPASVAGQVLATCVKALADAVVEARHGKSAAEANASRPRPKPKGRPAPASAPDDDVVYRRAVAYLDGMPVAISGKGGHAATYAAATAMIHGFGLEPNVAYSLLIERYNPRCKPPWSESELWHKVDDAANKEHDKPRGWLRDAERDYGPGAAVLPRTGPPPPTNGTAKVAKPAGPKFDLTTMMPTDGFFPDYVALSKSGTDACDQFHLAAALSVYSTTVGKNAYVRLGHTTLYPNFWIVLVGPSTLSRKTTVQNVAVGVLMDFAVTPSQIRPSQIRRVMTGSMTPEAFKSEMGVMINKEGQVIDGEENPEGVSLIVLGELGRFLGEAKLRHNAAWLELLTELYDSPPIYHSKTKTKGRFELRTPFVGLFACSTLEWISRHLDEDMISGGFLPRFLFWICPPDHKTGGVPGRVDAELEGEVRHHLREVDGRQYGEITLDDGAATVYQDWIADVEGRMRLVSDAIRAFWGRMNASALKIATLYAIANGQPTIDEEVLRPAIRLIEWHQHAVLGFLDQLDPTRFAKQLSRVMELVRRHGDGKPVPRRDIIRYAKFPPRELTDVLTTLVDGGQLALTKGPMGGERYVEVSN